MRSILSRLPGDPVDMTGHNNGPPLDAGRRGRIHAWGVARKALLPKLPLEVVRRRVARAKELGLAYPAYASILLGSGRDVTAFLFTDDALRVARDGRLAPDRAAKLRALIRVDRALLAAHGVDAAALAERVAAREAVRFAAAGAEGAGLAGGAAAVRAALAPLRLPADAVVMVGDRSDQRAWAQEARLARFLSATAYFEGV